MSTVVVEFTVVNGVIVQVTETGDGMDGKPLTDRRDIEDAVERVYNAPIAMGNVPPVEGL